MTLTSTRTPFGSVRKSWRSPAAGTVVRDGLDAERAQPLGEPGAAVRAERDVVDRRRIDAQAEPRGPSLVGGALGDVDAGDAVEVEPVAGKSELGPLPGLEPERVAVERPRRLEVVGQDEQVVEAP